MGYVATSAADAGRSSKGDGSKMSFSKEELKDLFKFNPRDAVRHGGRAEKRGETNDGDWRKAGSAQHWRAARQTRSRAARRSLARALGEVHRGPGGATAVWIPRIQPCQAAGWFPSCAGCRRLRRRPCRLEDVERGDSVSEPAEDEGDNGDDDDDDDA